MASNPFMHRDYYRRDERSGVSPPNLAKTCTFEEHIVRARGRRTQYTSVSLDLKKLREFGDTDYRLERDKLAADQHQLVEHEALMEALRATARESEKARRLQAVQALRYAGRRLEGLVDWKFHVDGLARKNLVTWAESKVQEYFTRI